MRKFLIGLIFFSIILLSGCVSSETEEFTAQPRDYVEKKTKADTEGKYLTTEYVKNQNEQDNLSNSEGIQKNYPDIDFSKKEIQGVDEELTSRLTLKSRYFKDNNSEYEYYEGSFMEKSRFCIRINKAEIIDGYDNVDDYFKNSYPLNDPDFAKVYGDKVIKNSKYLKIDMSIKDVSEDTVSVCMGNKNIESVSGEVGIYNISNLVGEFLTFDYSGPERGTGKEGWFITLGSGQELTFNVLYMLNEDVDTDSLYYNVNNMFRSGWTDDKNVWHADDEGAPNIIRLSVNEE